MHYLPSDTRNTIPDTVAKDNNMVLFHGDAASSAIDDAAVAYQSPSLIAAGADAQQVSILSVLINLGMAALCVKAPEILYRAGLARKGAVLLSFLSLCGWAPLALVFLVSGLGITPAWLALVWFVNLAPGLLLSVQRDNWLANIVPAATLNRYLGQRMAIKSAFYLSGFLTLGYIMDEVPTGMGGFIIVCAIATGAALVDFLMFTFMKEQTGENEPNTPNAQPAFSFLAYLKELQEKKLGKFTAYTTLIYLTVGFSGPLYAVYMLRELQMSYVTFTIIIACEFLARIVSMPVWGRLSDRVGNIRVLGIVSRVIPFLPVLWLVSPHPGFLITIQVVSGCCWGAFDLNTQSYLMKAAPRSKRLWYIVYGRCLLLLSTALGGFIGAASVDAVMPILGSSSLSMFLFSGIARMVIVATMVPGLIDIIHDFGKQAEAMRKPGSIHVIPHQGLFYTRYERGQRPLEKPVTFKRTETPVEFHEIRKYSTKPPKPVAVEKPLHTAQDGLYYRKTANMENLEAVAAREVTPSPRSTLYHDEARWRKYFRESLTALLEEDRRTANTPAFVTPVVY